MSANAKIYPKIPSSAAQKNGPKTIISESQPKKHQKMLTKPAMLTEQEHYMHYTSSTIK